jgi:hypothetical protein
VGNEDSVRRAPATEARATPPIAPMSTAIVTSPVKRRRKFARKRNHAIRRAWITAPLTSTHDELPDRRRQSSRNDIAKEERRQQGHASCYHPHSSRRSSENRVSSSFKRGFDATDVAVIIHEDRDIGEAVTRQLAFE